MPTFRIGARGLLGKEMHIRACVETTAFRETHAECRGQRLEGREVAFPRGTYGMRVFHGAKVSEPDPGALLAHPGPLLHEVMEELEHSPAPSRAEREDMLEEVRSAFADEAATLVEHEALSYRKPDPADAVELDLAERPDVATVHRSEPRRNWRVRPRRVVVRRDARRGRPAKKRGADPPAD